MRTQKVTGRVLCKDCGISTYARVDVDDGDLIRAQVEVRAKCRRFGWRDFSTVGDMLCEKCAAKRDAEAAT